MKDESERKRETTFKLCAVDSCMAETIRRHSDSHRGNGQRMEVAREKRTRNDDDDDDTAVAAAAATAAEEVSQTKAIEAFTSNTT